MFNRFLKGWKWRRFAQGDIVKLVGTHTPNPYYDYDEIDIRGFDKQLEFLIFAVKDVRSAMIIDDEPAKMPKYTEKYFSVLVVLKDGSLLNVYIRKDNIKHV
jgi:hypothetical protein